MILPTPELPYKNAPFCSIELKNELYGSFMIFSESGIFKPDTAPADHKTVIYIGWKITYLIALNSHFLSYLELWLDMTTDIDLVEFLVNGEQAPAHRFGCVHHIH
jgi:hypothetical protein